MAPVYGRWSLFVGVVVVKNDDVVMLCVWTAFYFMSFEKATRTGRHTRQNLRTRDRMRKSKMPINLQNASRRGKRRRNVENFCLHSVQIRHVVSLLVESL